MCEDSKCTCPTMKPGATTRPPRSRTSAAVVKLPRGWTLAIIGPTIPISASRSSRVATSTTLPPVSRRSNGVRPWAASMALSRTESSIASFICVSAGRSLGPDIRRLHHGRELIDLVRQKGAELRRRIADDAQAHLGQLAAHLGVLKGRDGRIVQPCDDDGI